MGSVGLNPYRGPGREAASEAGEWLSDESGVMRHNFFFFEIGGASWWRVCYQQDQVFTRPGLWARPSHCLDVRVCVTMILESGFGFNEVPATNNT